MPNVQLKQHDVALLGVQDMLQKKHTPNRYRDASGVRHLAQLF